MESKTKKVLLFWNGTKKEAIHIIDELKKHSLDTVYLVVLEDTQFEIPGTVVHLAVPARDGEPAPGIDTNVFDPPSADLISKLYRTESLALTMMNRKVDTLKRPKTVDEKKHFYYEQLRYWYGVISSLDIDLIILPSIPHNVPSFISYSIMRVLDRQSILFEWTWVSDRLLVKQDFDKQGENLSCKIKENENRNFTLSDLSEDIREYYEFHVNPKEGVPSVYVGRLKEIANKYSFWNRMSQRLGALMHSILDLSVFIKIVESIRLRCDTNLKKEYEKYSQVVDLDKKFVYVPLHLQPEGSTAPLGDMFVDQLLMVKMLSSALPEGWFLYVKEHPSQWSVNKIYWFSNVRYREYYESLARIPSVVIVPVDIDTYTLMEKAQAVATVAGTASLEAVFRGKPSVIFGYPWFQCMPGIFKVSSADDCRDVFSLIKSGYTPNWQKLLNYFKSFDEVSLHGYAAIFKNYIKRFAKTSQEESIEFLIQAVVKEAKSR
jgi:hypothetical protein